MKQSEKLFPATVMITEDRIAFVQDIMSRCISMMFSELNPEARKSLATAMLQRMAHELKGQLNR